MNKLEIDTEKNKFLLNGKPIKNATEITIRITPNDIPEATITVMCETDMVLNNCELADSWNCESIVLVRALRRKNCWQNKTGGDWMKSIILLTIVNWLFNILFTVVAFKFFYGECKFRKVLKAVLILIFCIMLCNLVVSLFLLF